MARVAKAVAAPRPEGLAPSEMIIDLFAGGGGASTAIRMATGREPDVAVNHDPSAIALHEANHPATRHFCCDVFEVDPVATCSDVHGNLRPVGLLWASPDCTHHSKARGGKPADKKIRALAWVVVKWAAKVKPRAIFLENVEEFQDWGPLGEDNRPIKERRGEIFRVWVSQLEALGYRVEWRELVAADYGAPTTRKRLFLVARRDGRPIVWPQQTHAARKAMKSPSLFDPPMSVWRAAAEIIDWNLPCPSIFGRKKPLAPKTQTRIAKGIKKFVIEAKSPFIVPVINGTWNPDRSWSVGDPLRTVTASNGGDYAVVAPTLTPRYGEAPGQAPRSLDIAEPYPTVVPTGNGGDLTGAVLQAAPVVLGTDNHSTRASRTFSVHDPLRTVVASGGHGIASAALAPTLVGSAYGDDRPGAGLRAWPADEPVRTVTSSGAGGFNVVAAHITKFSENSTGTDPSDPLHTAMAGAPRHGLVTAHLGRQFGTAVGRDMAEPHPTVMTDGAGGKSYVATACLDAYYGMSLPESIDEPVRTITTKDRHGLIVPVIDKYYATGVPSDPAEPLDTATAKARFGLTSAFMEQANTGVIGHEASAPVSTILAAGSHQRPVQLALEALEGEPGSRRATVLTFLREHFGEPTEAERADPLATIQGRLRFGLVMIGGDVWQIADIGMRMLTPRELYGAQGFPKDYIIDRTADGRALTKTAQTRMVGNSVSPPVAAALIAANDPMLSLRAAA